MKIQPRPIINIVRIAKRCPENISLVVKVSECSYIQIFDNSNFVKNFVFEFYHNKDLEFCHNIGFVTFKVFELRHNLSFVTI